MTVENELHKVHVCYTSRTPGLMAIHVTVGGVPIKQSPFIVEVSWRKKCLFILFFSYFHYLATVWFS
jgi:hypothetical protein